VIFTCQIVQIDPGEWGWVEKVHYHPFQYAQKRLLCGIYKDGSILHGISMKRGGRKKSLALSTDGYVCSVVSAELEFS
jgi:hypothetical protein